MSKYYLKSIEKITKKCLYDLYKINYNFKLNFQYKKKSYPGDITLVLFSLSKNIKKPIKEIGENIGNYLTNYFNGLIKYYIINGFLNFIFLDGYYIFLLKNMLNPNFYKLNFSSKNILIEFSSPNANKPLHIGHIRNILIGDSISRILSSVGNNIMKIQMINDRGIHICKSMIAWKEFGIRNTPIKTKEKGDHFVGRFYKMFHLIYDKEIKKKSINGKEAPILKKARILLKKWEDGDKETIKIWKMMNKWVYNGFKKTYNELDISFDKTEYESDIYNFGKKIIENGLKNGIFFKKKDGSIWIDLKNEGFNNKLLLRSDKTSVYITQDIGTAINRFNKYKIDNLIYIVGKEQNDYFKILFTILKRLGCIWVSKIYHLSYEMVFLSSGKMKSREGQVISADDLIYQMINMAKKKLKVQCKDYNNYCKTIGLSALKYYFLKVDPSKKIVFYPEKSIDFKGKTGIYIQYTYSRIRSLETKFFEECNITDNYNLSHSIIWDNIYGKNIIKIIKKYPFILKKSAKNLNPSILANYIYEVSKKFNNLYQNKKLIDPFTPIKSNNYMNIIHITGNILKNGMNLLGIKMMNKM